MSLPSSSPRIRSIMPRAGFTLLEILTTISIISVLAVMLLSAARGIRDKAKSAQCLSNLNQIRIASQLYSQDNDGYPPPAHFNEKLKPYVEVGQSNAAARPKNVWICPADQRPNKDMGSGPVSYAYNPDAIGWPSENGQSYYEKAKRPWSAINSTGKTIMFLDADMYYCNSGNRWAAFRHSKALNAVFFDGHIETLKFSDPNELYDQKYWAN